jgi:hypothetical protein
MNQKLWFHAPKAIGARVRSRTTSIVGVMYLEMYLPKAEFFSLLRSGGQSIIAAETITGGTKPTIIAGVI